MHDGERMVAIREEMEELQNSIDEAERKWRAGDTIDLAYASPFCFDSFAKLRLH